MISLQTQIRLYIVVSIIIYIVCTISIFLLNTYITNSLGEALNQYKHLSEFLNKIYIFTIVFSVAAFLFGVYVFVFTNIRGLNRYREIAKRLTNITEQEIFDLKSIRFPAEDEFGGIGRDLNSIVHKLQKFDELKVQRIKVEEMIVRKLLEKMDMPVLVVKVDNEDKIIKDYNTKFERIFARKKDKEDQYYDLKNFYLKALIIQSEKKQDADEAVQEAVQEGIQEGIQEGAAPANPFKGVLESFNDMSEKELIYSFIDKEFEDAINLAIADLNEVSIKKDVRTIRGDEVWHSDHVDIVPAWNDYGKTLDVLIMFNKLKKK